MATTSLREGGPPLKGPFDFEDSPLSRAARQPLLLGVFLDLQDRKISRHPTTTTWTFDYNAEVVRKADELGFDIAFSRSSWLPKDGWDGETSIDSFIALAAMAPMTKNILVISSIHVLYGPLHPLHIAKYGATLDHISKGRWGINILTGHRAVEHQMFGWNRIEHDKRYEMTGELFDVVNSLWGETEGLTYEGRLNPWKLQNAWISPKPLYGRPILVNATGSAAGIDFAVRYSDLIFITSPGGASIEAAIATLPDHIANIRKKAQSTGRTIKILINPIILSRDTVEETEDYLQKIVAAQGDTPHSHPQVRYESDAHAWRGRKDSNYPQGYNLGANIEVIGTPAQVVEQLKFLHEIGIDGVQFTFYDWVIDFDHFAAKILPLLKDAGLRVD